MTSSADLETLSSGPSPNPTQLPDADSKFDIEKFRQTEQARKLVAWVRSEHTKAGQARSSKVIQWRQNLMMVFGNQWAERVRGSMPSGFQDTFVAPKKPYYKEQRVINRSRSFVRSEHSKFLSNIPTAVAVPATAEDEDVRAAFAAEQAWQSISETRKLRQHYTKAAWWAITTGNGFIKTWWDQTCIPDRTEPENKGDIRFGAVSPFNLFVPDLREQDIEDQPFVITAYKKPVGWAKIAFKDALGNAKLSPSQSTEATLMEEAALNLQNASQAPEAVIVYEAWVKPGATELLPHGGLVIAVEDHLVGVYMDGLPYAHSQYPFTKFEHIPTAAFYADSPLVDTNQLQKEYNEWRSRISEYVRRSSAPQLMYQKGSLDANRITNEPGQMIPYKPGFSAPTPLPLTPLPQYVMDMPSLILQDWEDLTGQREVTQGSAPAGVTAGTAINYLQEAANKYLTPQYQSIEDGYEKIAGQSLVLFNQYVDMRRKIKTVGTDGSFDTVMLQGADIKNGLDIRIQRGSAVGDSQAAKEAKIMDMFSVGLIPQDMALKLLEVGGPQKIMDIISVAERKAQRENTKMKMLKPEQVRMHEMQFEMQAMQGMPMTESPSNILSDGSVEGPPEPPETPPVVPVDDFDMHKVHIETHNRFRMSQEYESLAPEIKAQFELHVKQHENAEMQAQMTKFLDMIPGDGSEEGAPDESLEVPIGEEGGDMQEPDTLAANGAAPVPETLGS